MQLHVTPTIPQHCKALSYQDEWDMSTYLRSNDGEQKILHLSQALYVDNIK